MVWLGGHVFNWPDTNEFNLKQDIGGAQVLFDSGAPVVLVPCMELPPFAQYRPRD